jgi:hypothetical protein
MQQQQQLLLLPVNADAGPDELSNLLQPIFGVFTTEAKTRIFVHRNAPNNNNQTDDALVRLHVRALNHYNQLDKLAAAISSDNYLSQILGSTRTNANPTPSWVKTGTFMYLLYSGVYRFKTDGLYFGSTKPNTKDSWMRQTAEYVLTKIYEARNLNNGQDRLLSAINSETSARPYTFAYFQHTHALEETMKALTKVIFDWWIRIGNYNTNAQSLHQQKLLDTEDKFGRPGVRILNINQLAIHRFDLKPQTLNFNRIRAPNASCTATSAAKKVLKRLKRVNVEMADKLTDWLRSGNQTADYARAIEKYLATLRRVDENWAQKFENVDLHAVAAKALRDSKANRNFSSKEKADIILGALVGITGIDLNGNVISAKGKAKTKADEQCDDFDKFLEDVNNYNKNSTSNSNNTGNNNNNKNNKNNNNNGTTRRGQHNSADLDMADAAIRTSSMVAAGGKPMLAQRRKRDYSREELLEQQFEKDHWACPGQSEELKCGKLCPPRSKECEACGFRTPAYARQLRIEMEEHQRRVQAEIQQRQQRQQQQRQQQHEARQREREKRRENEEQQRRQENSFMMNAGDLDALFESHREEANRRDKERK